MDYYKYQFKVLPYVPGAEVLMSDLGDAGFESFEEDSEAFVVTGYVPVNELNETVIAEVISSINNCSVELLSKELIKAQNWNAAWESSFSPIMVEDKVCIRATFHQAPPVGVMDVLINPKMSFGTGHHDTTFQMIVAMLGFGWKGKSVLDMGCGTGVLAIVASKLGAASLHAIDIDQWSIENAEENFALNSVSGILLEKGTSQLLGKLNYDYILANINKNVLLADLAIYASCLKTDGFLFLSGFFATDASELIGKAAVCGLQLTAKLERNNWACLVLKK